jgi:hypothetical protein
MHETFATILEFTGAPGQCALLVWLVFESINLKHRVSTLETKLTTLESRNV